MKYLRKLEPRTTIAFFVGGILVLLSWTKYFDTQTEEFVESSLTKSTAAFVVSRTINAAVSMTQTATVSFGVVAEGSMGIGQLLDPINDLVEDYSTIMKISIASLLIQRVLLEIFSSDIFGLFLSIVFIALLASTILSWQKTKDFLFKIFFFILYLRFILVLVLFANHAVSANFIEEKLDNELAVQKGYQSQLEASISENGISTEFRQQLFNESASLETQIQDIKNEREQLEEEISEKDIEIANAQETIRSFGAVQRINPLNENEALAQARDILDQQQQAREVNLSRIQELETESNSLLGQVQQINLALEGKEGITLSNLPQRIAELVQRARISISEFERPTKESVEKVMEGFSKSVLNSIALFSLQCIFSPLLFFYLFSKVAKYLWGIDLAVLLSERKPTANKVNTENSVA